VRNVFQVLLALVAVFGLGLGLAFGGGVLYGRKTAKAAPAPAVVTPQAGGGGFGAGAAAGQGGQGGQAGGQGRNTAGVIEKVEGNTVTLRTQGGGTTTISLASDTEIRQTVPAQASDLKPGQTVVVTGNPGADGAVQARSVTIAPAGGAGQGQEQGQAGQGARPGGTSGARGAAPSATPSATATPHP
jgi:hypothetical protein